MTFIRKVANSDILAHIIDIPEKLKHRQVEIIVLPYDEIPHGKDNTITKGSLHAYSNPNLINQESSVWIDTIKNKDEIW